MRFRVSNGRLLSGLAASGLLLVLAGCQSGSMFGGGEEKPVEKVLASELLGYCPKVNLREGTSVLDTYAKGGDGDPAKLIYQASISDVTRSCKRAGGMLDITVGVAGRVVPGPAAPPGEVTLPVRIVASRGDEVLYSQLNQNTVALGDASVAVQFVFNDPNVSIPDPTTQDISIYAGFDAGPAKKKSNAQ